MVQLELQPEQRQAVTAIIIEAVKRQFGFIMILPRTSSLKLVTRISLPADILKTPVLTMILTGSIHN